MRKNLSAALCFAFLALLVGCATPATENNNNATTFKEETMVVSTTSEPTQQSDEEQHEPIVQNSNSASGDLNSEIEGIEYLSVDLLKDISNAQTQVEMNEIAIERAELWDDELNSLWERLIKAADEKEREELLKDEVQWIAYKEQKIYDDNRDYEGGTIYALMASNTNAALTRNRCYVLAGLLAECSGEDFSLTDTDFYMEFANNQESPENYSSLILRRNQGSSYDTDVFVNGMYFLSGISEKNTDGTYNFEDNQLGIKGIIRMKDGVTASFVVSESDVEEIRAGTEYLFYAN